MFLGIIGITAVTVIAISITSFVIMIIDVSLIRSYLSRAYRYNDVYYHL